MIAEKYGPMLGILEPKAKNGRHGRERQEIVQPQRKLKREIIPVL